MGKVVGGTVLCLAAGGWTAGVAAAAEASPAPEPAAARLAPPTGSVGSAGVYAVGGGLVVVAGGAAAWLRKRRKA
ncbi:hypothetical protein ACFY00_21200 [Kitasatospora sp. NPDC001540]|uniref:hypothetical protein n=1 Tax=Kitasatospora sp. NPDC001540 TaxID=3364014 RepID=UPI0036BE4EBF